MEALWGAHVARWHAKMAQERKDREEKKAVADKLKLDVKMDDRKDVEMKVEDKKDPFTLTMGGRIYPYRPEEKVGDIKLEIPAPVSIPMPSSPKPAQYTGTKRGASAAFETKEESKSKQARSDGPPLGLEESSRLEEKPIVVSETHFVAAAAPSAMECESTAAPHKVQCGDESFESSLIETDFDEKKH